MGRHFLLIGTAREVHPKIRALGHRLSLICPIRNLRTLPNFAIYDRIVGVPPSASPADWAAQAQLIQAQDPLHAVGGFNEVTQHLAASVAQAVGLPYHTPELIRRTRDKHHMRQVLLAAGVDPTASQIVSTTEDIEAFAQQHGFPIVLKPVDGRGSLGVSIVRGSADVSAALDWFSRWASDHQMLAEQFLQGEEWSVEAFSENGCHRIVCVTQKFKDPHTSVETGHCLPAPLPEATRVTIEHFIVGVLTALGLENGPSHTEVILTPAGPRVVETHARLAGDSIVELVQLASGVDLDELWIRQVAGESVLDAVPTQLNRWASIAFATPQAVGTLERIDGRELAEAVDGVVHVDLLQEPGAQLHGAYDSFSRGAFAIAVGDTSDAAVARARAAVGELRFVVSCAG